MTTTWGPESTRRGQPKNTWRRTVESELGFWFWSGALPPAPVRVAWKEIFTAPFPTLGDRPDDEDGNGDR